MMAGTAESCSEVSGNGKMDLMVEEDILTSSKASSKEDAAFDETIGHIQDILIDPLFSDVQGQFMEKHYKEFEDKEENKFIYSDIFKLYTDLVEQHLEKELLKRMPGFSMEAFMASLQTRKSEMNEEIFDMLLSFSDFLTFKQMFLDFKAEKEGLTPDLQGLIVTSLLTSKR